MRNWHLLSGLMVAWITFVGWAVGFDAVFDSLGMALGFLFDNPILLIPLGILLILYLKGPGARPVRAG